MANDTIKESVGGQGNAKPDVMRDVAEKLGVPDSRDVLMQMRKGSGDIVNKLQQDPQWVNSKFGSPEKMKAEIARLEQINKDKIDLLGRSQNFAQEMKKESWGQWALRKGKEIITYPIRHPWKTLGYALLATAAAAAATGAAFYLTGNWELFLTQSGLGKVLGAAKAAGELAPLTPGTAPLPGGGIFDVPPPMPTPGPYSPLPITT
jgi:hypothetical protein